MKNVWMLDVIEDLRRFADLNDMPRLADELSRVASVVKREVQQRDGPAPMGTAYDGTMGGRLSGALVAGDDT